MTTKQQDAVDAQRAAAQPAAPSSPPIAAVLAQVAEKVGAVAKGERFNGPGGGYQFRGIDAVVNAVSGPMHAAGVIVAPKARKITRGTASTAKGAVMNTVAVEVDYVFHGPAGDTLTARVFAEAFDSGDKATSKAMSVAFRTALLQVLTLPTNEPDPDAEAYDAQPETKATDAERAAAAEVVASVVEAVEATAPGSAERKAALRALWEKAGPRLIGVTVDVPDAWVERPTRVRLGNVIDGAMNVGGVR
jgi:hypothetical protein